MLEEKCIQDRIIKLRLELYKEFQVNGHSEKVIEISQELDKYILMVQEELLKK